MYSILLRTGRGSLWTCLPVSHNASDHAVGRPFTCRATPVGWQTRCGQEESRRKKKLPVRRREIDEARDVR